MKERITIGLIEDQVLFRNGIKAILESSDEFEVIFEAGEGYSVIDNLKIQRTPDVMLVDLSLPPNGSLAYSGEHLTMDLQKEFPEVKVLILSAHNDEQFISRLIEIGAHGYLLKDSDPEEVFAAIRDVCEKGVYINSLTLNALRRNIGKRTKPVQPTSELTRREQEIIALICQQFTADEIGEKLFISTKTVNGHKANLFQKTGSRNTAGLVMYAVKNGLVKF